MALKGLKVPKFNINRSLSVFTEYLTITGVNTAIQGIPSIPPLIKTISGISATFGLYGLMDKLLASLPKSIQGIGKAFLEVQMTLQIVALIPSLTSLFGGLSGLTGTTPGGTTTTTPGTTTTLLSATYPQFAVAAVPAGV